MLCLSLSLGTLLETELRSGSRHALSLQVKQHARLALKLAAGTLQEAMGPDRRISARADLLGDYCKNGNRRWIGVWDAAKPDATPQWLVSGPQADPRLEYPELFCEFSPGYDADRDGQFTSAGDVAPARAPWQRIDASLEIAWWIEDLGMRAPLAYTDGILDTLAKGATLPYLDYRKTTLDLAELRQDSLFDCPPLYDCANPGETNPAPEYLRRAQDWSELELSFESLDSPPTPEVRAELRASRCLRNAFVLSNPLDGGLKDDLSFLKTLDLGTISDAELQALYPKPTGLIHLDIARMVQTRRPLDRQFELLDCGILPPRTAIATGGAIHSLAPVLTEFRFSAGLAANADTKSGALYLVSKVYLELWNPYNVPLRIGDPAWPAALGYSDLVVKIENLPRYSLVNHDNGNSLNGSLADLQFRWSEEAPGKVLRSGMVFNKSLPEDSADGGVGTRRSAIGMEFPIAPEDRVTAYYRFGRDPIRIHLYAENSNGDSALLFTVEVENYPDFTIHYQHGNANRAAWFQRKIDSADGKYGMNNESLEVPGYAFSLRFKVLDRTRADWQRYLDEYEFRNPELEVDLADWDPAQAWERDPPLPYDFRVNDRDCDPANFDPAQFFSANDLFHYENAGSSVGRRHRIVRACDAPIAEKMNPGILQDLQAFPPTASPHDSYFFSTLPDPQLADWDGKQALFNARLRPLDPQQPPRLDSPASARELLLHNGFNCNSTDLASWIAVLAGQSFPPSSLQLRYEQSPEWFKPSETLRNLHFNHPQNAVYGLTEQSEDPAYEIQTRAETEDYPACFATTSTDWRSQRQHPAFIQNLREIDPAEIEALAQAILRELKNYYHTKGHPPLSMQSFIEAQVLQNAIDAVPTLNLRDSGIDLIPPGGPAHFSQATLLNSLAPFTFVRSDSFTLHAAARMRDPSSGVIVGEARCRAQAQRLPQAHPNAAFGRRFHISNFKWESYANE